MSNHVEVFYLVYDTDSAALYLEVFTDREEAIHAYDQRIHKHPRRDCTLRLVFPNFYVPHGGEPCPSTDRPTSSPA